MRKQHIDEREWPSFDETVMQMYRGFKQQDQHDNSRQCFDFKRKHGRRER